MALWKLPRKWPTGGIPEEHRPQHKLRTTIALWPHTPSAAAEPDLTTSWPACTAPLLVMMLTSETIFGVASTLSQRQRLVRRKRLTHDLWRCQVERKFRQDNGDSKSTLSCNLLACPLLHSFSSSSLATDAVPVSVNSTRRAVSWLTQNRLQCICPNTQVHNTICNLVNTEVATFRGSNTQRRIQEHSTDKVHPELKH